MKKENQGNQGGDDNRIGSKFGRKRNKKGGEEDDTPVRPRVREFIEGKYVTVIMSVTTIFALFGDDLRLWFS